MVWNDWRMASVAWELRAALLLSLLWETQGGKQTIAWAFGVKIWGSMLLVDLLSYTDFIHLFQCPISD